jgi:hypothetical protein
LLNVKKGIYFLRSQKIEKVNAISQLSALYFLFLNSLFPMNYICFRSCYTVDTLMAVSIAAVTFATMLPMSIYSGKVLLQVRMSLQLQWCAYYGNLL